MQSVLCLLPVSVDRTSTCMYMQVPQHPMYTLSNTTLLRSLPTRVTHFCLFIIYHRLSNPKTLTTLPQKSRSTLRLTLPPQAYKRKSLPTRMQNLQQPMRAWTSWSRTWLGLILRKQQCMATQISRVYFTPGEVIL